MQIHQKINRNSSLNCSNLFATIEGVLGVSTTQYFLFGRGKHFQTDQYSMGST